MATNESSTGQDDIAIRVDSLEKTYGSGDDAVTAVDDVSFEIESGTIVGLLGPNGAGKTTTIKSMLGLIVPGNGDVSIAGIDVDAEPERAHSHVGAMLEGDRNVYWRLTVRENLEYFAGLGGQRPATVRERHDELLERLDLLDRADTVVNELSKGMKQKVSLASTLARDVEVIFLDEPTLGLDVETSRDLYRELRRLAEEDDITIVLTSHNLDIIEAVSDRVIILNEGEVIADDDTDALIDLFQTQSYRVTVDAPVGDAVRERLEREFDATIERDGDYTTIECRGLDSDGAYALIETLKGTGQELLEVESVEPDLEDVFLRMTGDEESTADTADGPENDQGRGGIDQETVPGTPEEETGTAGGRTGTQKDTAVSATAGTQGTASGGGQ